MAKRKAKVSVSKSKVENVDPPVEETVFIDASDIPIAKEDNAAISKEDKVYSGETESKNISNFATLNNRLLIVKVDTGNLSPEEADTEIKKVETTLGKLFEDNKVNCLLYVTHHKFQVEII